MFRVTEGFVVMDELDADDLVHELRAKRQAALDELLGTPPLPFEGEGGRGAVKLADAVNELERGPTPSGRGGARTRSTRSAPTAAITRIAARVRARGPFLCVGCWDVR